MEDNDTLTYDTRLILTIFKNFFSNSAESLLIKLPNPLDKCNVESVTFIPELLFQIYNDR